MNPIFGAMAAGYTTKEIINFISKMFPGFSGKISQAVSSGYTPDEIIKYLQNFKKDEFKKISKRGDKNTNYRLPDEDDSPKTSMQKANELWYGGKEEFVPEQKQQKPSILPALGNAAIGVAGGLAAPVVKNALSRALPSLSPFLQQQQQSQQMPQQSPETILQDKLNQTQQPPVNQQVTQNIPQSQPFAQPQGFDTNIIKNSYAYKRQIDALINSGNGPEEIEAYLQKFNPQFIKTISKEGKGDFKDVVAQYIQEKIRDEAMQPEGSLPNAKTEQQQPQLQKETGLPEAEKQPEERKPIGKSEIVASPHGVGEVKEIRNGQAIIDVDGKLHKVKAEELESEPEEVRESKFDFNPDEVPEDLRSAPLNEVYLPHDRRHVTVKYNAGLKPIRYIYFRKDDKPIATDYINKIVKGVQLPVSSGKSFWGSWRADLSDSRGAANYEELVSNAQEEGEPDDPSKEYWFIKEEALYEHPYMEKAGKEELRAKEKAFNEAKKKPRKKKKA